MMMMMLIMMVTPLMNCSVSGGIDPVILKYQNQIDVCQVTEIEVKTITLDIREGIHFSCRILWTLWLDCDGNLP
jgi:hypothetical protein